MLRRYGASPLRRRPGCRGAVAAARAQLGRTTKARAPSTPHTCRPAPHRAPTTGMAPPRWRAAPRRPRALLQSVHRSARPARSGGGCRCRSASRGCSSSRPGLQRLHPVSALRETLDQDDAVLDGEHTTERGAIEQALGVTLHVLDDLQRAPPGLDRVRIEVGLVRIRVRLVDDDAVLGTRVERIDRDDRGGERDEHLRATTRSQRQVMHSPRIGRGCVSSCPSRANRSPEDSQRLRTRPAWRAPAAPSGSYRTACG